MSKEFVWTDELVHEFAANPTVWGTTSERAITNFKWNWFNKQPKEHSKEDAGWEIVGYKFNGDVYILEGDGKYRYRSGKGIAYYLSSYSESERKIHSVKRLSDNVVFSVGDEVGSKHFSLDKIISFTIRDSDDMWVSLSHDTCDLCWLSKIPETLKSKPTPLFTTEDGVDVKLGDSYWYVNMQLKLHKLCANKTMAWARHLMPSEKIFSTEEKAEEYILMNKPCLSVQNLIDHFNSHHFGQGEYQLQRLKELAKSKLK